jgi:predicted esterase
MRSFPLLTLALLACYAPGEKDIEDTQPPEGDTDTDADGDTDSDADGDTDADADADADSDADTDHDPPEWCEPARAGELQHITTHPMQPYWVHQPDTDALDVPTVVFLPGGGGGDNVGPAMYDTWFRAGEDLPEWRVLIVTAADNDLTDEWDRIVPALDEVLDCYGGDPDKVHIGGTSNGGLGAYSVMLDRPERFATLLGAPGLWLTWNPTSVEAALVDKAVFNGVGEYDKGWYGYVEQTHELLLGLGIDSDFVVFEGQGHIPDRSFDPAPLFAFWEDHS